MKRGFTLIELLVVIAIIAILAAILFPVFAKAREKARQTKCTSNLRQIALAAQMYAQENDEKFPPTTGFWTDIQVPSAVYVCPTKKNLTNGYVFVDYWGGKSLGDIPNASNATLVADGEKKSTGTAANAAYKSIDYDLRHDKKTIVGYADGHVAMKASAPYAYEFTVNSHLDHWYKADDCNGFANNQWPNRGVDEHPWVGWGPATHLWVGSGTPAYTASSASLNDMPTFTFPAGASLTTVTSTFSYDPPSTAFVIYNTADADGTIVHTNDQYDALYTKGGQLYFTIWMYDYFGSPANEEYDWGNGTVNAIANLGVVGTGKHVVAILRSSVSGWAGVQRGTEVWVDGKLKWKRAYGSIYAGYGISLGQSTDGAREWQKQFAGEIPEYIRVSSALSASEIMDVTKYLAVKYGVNID